MVWQRIGRNLLGGAPGEAAALVSEETVRGLARQIDAAAQTRLGRSLALLHVDTGSCGGCEWELRALRGVLYDLERFGLTFVASPRHADVLLVTGPLTRNLREALAQAWDAMPDPKWLVGIGDCAVDGGVFKGSYAIEGGAGGGGVGAALHVDLMIPGCPPAPAQILAGLRSLLEANARG